MSPQAAVGGLPAPSLSSWRGPGRLEPVCRRPVCFPGKAKYLYRMPKRSTSACTLSSGGLQEAESAELARLFSLPVERLETGLTMTIVRETAKETYLFWSMCQISSLGY